VKHLAPTLAPSRKRQTRQFGTAHLVLVKGLRFSNRTQDNLVLDLDDNAPRELRPCNSAVDLALAALDKLRPPLFFQLPR